MSIKLICKSKFCNNKVWKLMLCVKDKGHTYISAPLDLINSRPQVVRLTSGHRSHKNE